MVTPAPSSFDPAARLGTVVAGKYRLERLLGAGGMGAVFEAVHTGVQRRFAVKVMTSDPTRSPEAVRRFTQEAQAAGLIGHPHIVEVFDLGESEDGTLYMVMELLRGETLHSLLRNGPLAQADAVAICLELLRALDAAHRAGIVHRDIKPHNLFLAERSGGGAALKVLDFGIAKFHEPDASTITRSGSIVGTPLYMAPEQVLSDREIDGRADVWAAGATLFEMLTGRPVHLAPHAAAAAVRIVTEPAPRVRSLRADVDPELDDVVAKALTIERDERFASAADMIDALEAIAPRLPPTDRGPLVTPTSPVRAVSPSGSGMRVTPSASGANLTPQRTDDKRSAAKSGLLIFGALALVGGAAAGTLLMPLPGTPPAGTATASTASAVTSSSTVVEPPAPAPTPTPTPTRADVPDAALPVAGSATAASSTGSPMPPTPLVSTKPTGKRPDIKPVTSGSAATSAVPVQEPKPTCGPREVVSNGHCCPIGMVWQKDHCDRPLATGF